MKKYLRAVTTLIRFRSDEYLELNPDLVNFRFPLVLHYLLFGLSEKRATRVTPSEDKHQELYSSSEKEFDPTKYSLVLFSHSSTRKAFGAERSFIDMVRASCALEEVQVSVVLPEENKALESVLFSLGCHQVIVCSISWGLEGRRLGRRISEIAQILRETRADLVIANSAVLVSPLRAARLLGIPCISMVREVIEDDRELFREGKAYLKTIERASTHIVTNSKTTAQQFRNFAGSISVISNIVDTPKRPGGPRERFTVGLVSSNIPKKGLGDFIAIAEMAQHSSLGIVFEIWGPKTPHSTSLESKCRALRLKNVKFCGYAEDPDDIYENLSVLFSLSKFPETFGRTIAEALARGIPVIAYDRGAVSELVLDKFNGFLVKADSIPAAFESLNKIYTDPMVLSGLQMGAMASSANVVDQERYTAEWAELIGRYLNVPKQLAAVKSSAATLSVSVVIPVYNSEKWIESRIRNVLSQSKQPSEIIIVDDGSTDKTVQLAQRVMEATENQVPLRVVTHKQNLGVTAAWISGVNAATSDLCWIAEVDDSADVDFIATMSPHFNDEETQIAFCASRKVSESGKLISEANMEHYAPLPINFWTFSHTADARLYFRQFAQLINPIPNASAVIFRRSKSPLSLDKTYKYAGDLWFYSELASSGRIVFEDKILNSFVRHDSSVTKLGLGSEDYADELELIRNQISESFGTSSSTRFQQSNGLRKLSDKYLQHAYSPLSVGDEDPSSRHSSPELLIVSTNPNSIDGGSERIWWDLAQARPDLIIQIHHASRNLEREKLRNLLIRGVEFRTLDLSFLREQFSSGFIPDQVVLLQGNQFEPEQYNFFQLMKEFRVEYLILNQLVNPSHLQFANPIRCSEAREIFLGARRVGFTSQRSLNDLEIGLGITLPDTFVHDNPFERFSPTNFQPASTLRDHVAVPSRIVFEHKGQDLLIESLSDAAISKSGLIFHLYGDGRDFKKMIEMIIDNGLEHLFVHHPPAQSLADIWKTCGALIMPSRMEGMPLVLMSGMSAGRLAIVTDAGGMHEVVADQESGIAIRGLTSDAIRKALTTYLTLEDKEIDLLAESGSTRIGKEPPNYSWIEYPGPT